MKRKRNSRLTTDEVEKLLGYGEELCTEFLDPDTRCTLSRYGGKNNVIMTNREWLDELFEIKKSRGLSCRYIRNDKGLAALVCQAREEQNANI